MAFCAFPRIVHVFFTNEPQSGVLLLSDTKVFQFSKKDQRGRTSESGLQDYNPTLEYVLNRSIACYFSSEYRQPSYPIPVPSLTV